MKEEEKKEDKNESRSDDEPSGPDPELESTFDKGIKKNSD